MDNYIVRVEAEPCESKLDVEVLGQENIPICIYHNMYEYEIEAAYINWSARIEKVEDITSQNLCNYILSKNSMTGHVASTTEEGLGIIISNAFEKDLTI